MGETYKQNRNNMRDRAQVYGVVLEEREPNLEPAIPSIPFKYCSFLQDKTLLYLPRRETTINRNMLFEEDLSILFCYSQDRGPGVYFQVELVLMYMNDLVSKIAKRSKGLLGPLRQDYDPSTSRYLDSAAWLGHRPTDSSGCHHPCVPEGLLHPGETVIAVLTGRSVKPTAELPSTLH